MTKHELKDTINRLLSWATTHREAAFSTQLIVHPSDVRNIKTALSDLAYHYGDKRPIYKSELLRISDLLFLNTGAYLYVQQIIFAQFYMFMLILNEETELDNQNWWQYVHPQIVDLSKKKFEDGHYNEAVRTAIIELCAIIRKFRKANGYDEIVSDVNMIRNTFKRESNILSFTNCDDETERNVQKGYENLFAGTMEAIRNLSAHNNSDMTESDSARKLMLLSDLMYMLDHALERRGDGCE